MGRIGRYVGGQVGKRVGKYAGQKLGKYTGVHADRGAKIGRKVGQELGDLLPFKKGGKVKKTGPIYAHKGEFVLPQGIRPTVKQLKKMKRK
jgi:hypothetical protein